jgi:hypothetical protein
MDSYKYMARLQHRFHQRAVRAQCEHCGPLTALSRLLPETVRETVNFIREGFLVIGLVTLLAVSYNALTGNSLIFLFQHMVRGINSIIH